MSHLSYTSDVCDEELMRRFRATLDDRAFEVLVARYAGCGAAVARRIIADAALAEDAVQETFLKIVRNVDRYDDTKPFSAWFFAVLRNVCVDMMRSMARADKVARNSVSARQFVDPPGDLQMDIQVALRRLPAGEREAVELRIQGQTPIKDIAALLGISPEAAKKRLQRGLRHLRDTIDCKTVTAESA